MAFFVDTADTAEIRSLAVSGLLDGATANPSLVPKTVKKSTDILRDIRGIVPGLVAAHNGMMREAAVPRQVAGNDTIEVPLTGIHAAAFQAEGTTGQTIA